MLVSLIAGVFPTVASGHLGQCLGDSFLCQRLTPHAGKAKMTQENVVFWNTWKLFDIDTTFFVLIGA